MANPEHLDILKQGLVIWNQWRQDYPEIQPDLRGTHLEGANLSHIDFNGVDLSYADLGGTDLSYSNLGGTHFGTCDLDYANLSYASLGYSYLSGTYLNKVSHSKMSFSDGRMGSTVFANIDLSQVQGLDIVTHQGPSEISIRTIYLSRGMIPESFLKGAGIPDSFITYARSLVNNPIDFYSCFISYSSHDEAFAKRLYADLQSNGVRCWFAPEDLKIGDPYHQRIDESIRLYDKLTLILSEHAVQSACVEREVVAAREREDREQRPVLFPIRLDDAVMNTTKAWAADVRRRWHIGDFTQWKDHDAYQQAFERLLCDLKRTGQIEIESRENRH